MANLIVRIFWTILIGWWVSIIWYIIGILLVALAITAPSGFWVLDRLEFVFSLERDPELTWKTGQRLIFGVIWFYLVGWWLGLAVIILAGACALLIIGFPLGVWLIKRLDDVVILE